MNRYVEVLVGHILIGGTWNLAIYGKGVSAQHFPDNGLFASERVLVFKFQLWSGPLVGQSGQGGGSRGGREEDFGSGCSQNYNQKMPSHGGPLDTANTPMLDPAANVGTVAAKHMSLSPRMKSNSPASFCYFGFTVPRSSLCSGCQGTGSRESATSASGLGNQGRNFAYETV